MKFIEKKIEKATKKVKVLLCVGAEERTKFRELSGGDLEAANMSKFFIYVALLLIGE